jgi:RHS repeat-associated protein
MKLAHTVRLLGLFLSSAATLHAASGQMTTFGIAAGANQAFALRSDGNVWGWGTNAAGELGISGVTASSFPLPVPGVSNVINIAAGWQHSLAVETNGTVWAWGTNASGQLGNGNNTSSPVPVPVTGITNAVMASGGAFHSLALLASGQIMAWGGNGQGQLGNGSYNSTNLPVLVTGLTNVVKVVAGGYHSVALDANGVVWCWGYGSYGEIGNGQNTFQPTPVAVLSNVVDIAAGAAHTMALQSNGSVWLWGYNYYGQLGLGTTTSTNAPTPVSLGGVQAIGAGFYSSSATLTNGQNFAWGFQGGIVASPTQLAPAPAFVKYALGNNAAGANFCLGMTTNGAVWAWGDNEYGQFGNGNILSPQTGNLSLIPTESFAPVPPARWGEFLRGDLYDFGNSSIHDLDFCSIVVPMDLEQGVALDATGGMAYCYSNAAPWFLNVSNQTLYVATALGSSMIPVNNPVTAFGSQGGGSQLIPNQPYRFGVYAGGFDESTPAATNVIQISVYSATNFPAGATNIAPINVFTIPLPRRTVSADSNLWTAFMTNGGAITVSTNGLTTTVQFLDSGNPNDEAFGLTWLNGQVITNFDLTGYELTHIASSTNYYYQVAVLGKVQVGNTSVVPFATNAAGVWTATPLYTLDFAQPSPLQSMYVNQLFFQGTPTPPTYAEASVAGPAGLMVMVTNQFVLYNNPVYTNLDSSPELRRHPVLDQFVLDMNNDPLALASYVINQIELADPYATGQGGTTVQPQVTCGGIDRSALGTFLEGRGSPVEQCALLVYLLRQAGYSAAYVFPTNNNLFMSASHVSQLFEMQVNGVLYPNGIPIITNSLLSLNYPWVVANIGTNTVNIFPWLKDHEIVEGVNLYDYLPTNYNTALAWVEQYVRGNTNILNLDAENVVSKLFPEFIEQYLSPLGPSFSTDNLGVRAFNRQHQFPSWSYLPQPDAVTNLNTLQLVDSLGNTTNFPNLANIFNTTRVQVYNNSVTGSPLLDSGNFDACDLDDRKFLVFTNNGQLCLWLAPYRNTVSNVQAFAGPSSLNLQSNSVAVGSISYLAIQSIHHRQVSKLTAPYTFFPLNDSTGVTNLSHCYLGDVAGIALDYGQITPLMLQQHEETYWGLEQERATNSSFVPKVWDYQGTAAYLLGMGYFQKNDAFDVYNQQWHKLHSLIKFSAGLGVIGATGNPTNMQAKVDMFNNVELYIGNASLNLSSGVPDFTSLQNYFTLNITAGSAQEHDMIQTMFPDQNAVSTVRLLQMAQQRATNGNAPVLEFFQNNYVAYGNQTNAGYGTNTLMNQDTNMWGSVSNIFTQVGASYARVLMTPGRMTNAPKTYIGMGALILGEDEQLAAISANSAVLNGGWGSEEPDFSDTTPVTQPDLSWNLDTSSDGSSPTFSLNDFSTGSTYLSALSPEDDAGLTSDPDLGTTPEQTSQATQISQETGQTGNTPFSLYSAANTGSLGPVNAQAQSLGQWIGEPVNVISGDFYVDTADVSLPGPLPLELRRNYSSLNLQANEMGYGWKINFTPYLVIASNLIYAAELNGTTLAYRATNSVWKVLPADNPTLNNYSTYGVGSTANLFNSVLTTNSGTHYTITAPDGGTRTYQTMSFPVASGTNVLSRTRPYLTRWQDNAGNYALFYYGTNATANDWGQLNRINMANGNTLVFKYDFYGRIVQALTGDGRFVSYQYDSYGDLVTVTLPDSSQCQYAYQHYTFTTNNSTITDSTHLISQEIKPSGRVVANAYDAMRRVVTQASTVGTNLVLYTNAYFFYTNNFTTNNYLTNQLASGLTVVRDFFHNPTTYYYTNNLVTNTVDALGKTSLQVWYPDTATNLPGWYPRSLQYTVDKRGLTNQFFYDSFGNVTQRVMSGNLTGENVANQTATNTVTYTTNNLPSTMSDPAGNGTQFIYDSADPFRPLQLTRVSGTTPVATNYYFYTNVTTVSYIGVTNLAYGLRWREVNAGATNDSVFNGNGFPIETIQYPATTDDPTNTDPAVIHYLSYNLRGQMYQDQTAGGGTIQYDFDPMGRTISKQVFDQNNNNLSSEYYYYNRNGELEWYDGPRSNPADYVYYIYDGAGRAIQQINFRSQGKSDGSGVEAPAGNAVYATTFQTFDGFGNQTSVTDPRGVVTTNWFDALGRVTQRQVWETNGTILKTEQTAYEPGGQVTLATNALGGVTQTLYTTTGKPYFVSNPDGSTNGRTYYLDGRLKREYAVNGSYWQTVYNDTNQLVTRSFYSGGGTLLATNLTGFDRRGNVILKVDALGNASTTVYDGLNRTKINGGPYITTVSSFIPGGNPTNALVYQTNVWRQAVTTYFDAAGLATTNVNTVGDTNLSQFDVLGRVISRQISNSSNSLVRITTTSYSADHQSVTTTDGTGATAIVSTTYTDNAGKPVLSIKYPSPGTRDYVLRQYDADENVIAETHATIANGTATTWTTASYVHDGLGRMVSKTDRDGALTTYAFDPAGDATNRTMPGGLQWEAIYNNAGQMEQEWNLGTTGSGAQTNIFTWFGGGSPFAGLLQSKADGRGVICAYAYDSWLRATNLAYTGTLPEQNLTTSLQYDPRGYVTGYIEQFASTSTGPATSIQRTFDPYGQLASESVNGGSTAYLDTQTWDAAGRRTQLDFGNTTQYGFAWRSDYTLAAFLAPNGSGYYGYDTAGLMTNRISNIRSATITSRDGEGRPLLIATTISGVTNLVESLSWLGDGLLATHTLVRPDFTDSRSYGYAPLSRRLTQEQLNLNGASTWTNNFAYDDGQPHGPGVLTSAGQTNAQWTGVPDAFSRVIGATNTTVTYSAYGHVTGLGTVNLWLDGNPVSVTGVGTNTTQWAATMELSPGPHQLVGSAVEQPSAQFTSWATNSFTNSIPYQTTSDTLDYAGNTTQRIWFNANGTTNRIQTLSWDARGRLHAITERDAGNSGYNWTAVYDALNRRLSTTEILVTNGFAFTSVPSTINQIYDPQADCLELGLAYGTKNIWKLYGPDMNGVYGGLNGQGGFDGYTTALGLFFPTVCDFRGNVLGYVTNGAVLWNPSRPTAYGAVPGYRPVALGNGANVPQSSAWEGRWPDITGYYNFHQRVYDPVTAHWLSGDPEWNELDPNYMTFCGGDPVNHADRDGKLSANNYTSNPGQGLGSDNGTLNQYFGIVAGTQTTVQTTAYLNNGNSFILGTDNVYDPNAVVGYTAQATTTQTGQYYLYSGSQPLPDNAGQASTVQLPLGAMMEQQANTLALQYLAMVPIVLDGGELLLTGGGADIATTETFYRTMSQENYQQLLNTGQIPATGETFITPSLQYAQQYNGVTVQFNVQAGTQDALMGMGVRNSANDFIGTSYESLPLVQSGWGSSSAFFKAEGNGLFNIGLGNGTALDTFNSSIVNFNAVPKP